MYCYADNNYQNNVVPCDSNPTIKKNNGGYALPSPTCPSTHPFAYNEGNDCCASNMDKDGQLLTEDSTTCKNMDSGATSVTCQNPPCCPNSIPEAYDFIGTRLCRKPGDTSWPCGPTGVTYGQPPCSQPYFIETAIGFGGVNMYGNDKNPSTPDISSCRELCQKADGCGTYQWGNWNGQEGECDLKPLQNINQDGVHSSLQGKYPNNNGGYVYKYPIFQPGTDLPGNDLPGSPHPSTSPDECRNRCITDPNKQCNAFTWGYSGTGKCYLKNKTKETLNPSSTDGVFGQQVISGILTDDDAQEMVNRELNNATVAISRENFQSAIDNIKVKTNIEHLITPDTLENTIKNKLTDEVKTNIKNNCATNQNSTQCRKYLNKTFPIGRNPSKNIINKPTHTIHSNNSCPLSHPYQYNNGYDCCNKPTMQKDNSLGVRWCDSDNSKPCPSGKCGDNLSVNVSKITTPTTSIGLNGDFTPSCRNDQDCIDLGMDGHQCVNANLDPNTGNSKDNDSRGVCIKQPYIYNKNHTLDNGAVSSIIEDSASKEYCATSCIGKSQIECVGWKHDFATNTCSLMSSVGGLNLTNNNKNPSGLRYDYNADATAQCQKNNSDSLNSIVAIPNSIECDTLSFAYTEGNSDGIDGYKCCGTSYCPDGSTHSTNGSGCHWCNNVKGICTVNTGKGPCGQTFCPYTYTETNCRENGQKGCWTNDLSYDRMVDLNNAIENCDSDNNCVGYFPIQDRAYLINDKQLPINYNPAPKYAMDKFMKKETMEGPTCYTSCDQTPWELCTTGCEGQGYTKNVDGTNLSKNQCSIDASGLQGNSSPWSLCNKPCTINRGDPVYSCADFVYQSGKDCVRECGAGCPEYSFIPTEQGENTTCSMKRGDQVYTCADFVFQNEANAISACPFPGTVGSKTFITYDSAYNTWTPKK